MQADLEQIISAIKSMDAADLEQLLDVAQTRYAEVASPEGETPSLPNLGEAPEDADPEYDAEMAGIPGIPPAAASPSEPDVDEDDDFTPVPGR